MLKDKATTVKSLPKSSLLPKKTRRTVIKKFTSLLMVAVTLVSCFSVVSASNSSGFIWDSANQDMAWFLYTVTNWDDVADLEDLDGLTFSIPVDGDTEATADVSTFINVYEGITTMGESSTRTTAEEEFINDGVAQINNTYKIESGTYAGYGIWESEIQQNWQTIGSDDTHPYYYFSEEMFSAYVLDFTWNIVPFSNLPLIVNYFQGCPYYWGTDGHLYCADFTNVYSWDDAAWAELQAAHDEGRFISWRTLIELLLTNTSPYYSSEVGIADHFWTPSAGYMKYEGLVIAVWYALWYQYYCGLVETDSGSYVSVSTVYSNSVEEEFSYTEMHFLGLWSSEESITVTYNPDVCHTYPFIYGGSSGKDDFADAEWNPLVMTTGYVTSMIYDTNGSKYTGYVTPSVGFGSQFYLNKGTLWYKTPVNSLLALIWRVLYACYEIQSDGSTSSSSGTFPLCRVYAYDSSAGTYDSSAPLSDRGNIYTMDGRLWAVISRVIYRNFTNVTKYYTDSYLTVYLTTPYASGSAAASLSWHNGEGLSFVDLIKKNYTVVQDGSTAKKININLY